MRLQVVANHHHRTLEMVVGVVEAGVVSRPLQVMPHPLLLQLHHHHHHHRQGDRQVGAGKVPLVGLRLLPVVVLHTTSSLDDRTLRGPPLLPGVSRIIISTMCDLLIVQDFRGWESSKGISHP